MPWPLRRHYSRSISITGLPGGEQCIRYRRPAQLCESVGVIMEFGPSFFLYLPLSLSSNQFDSCHFVSLNTAANARIFSAALACTFPHSDKCRISRKYAWFCRHVSRASTSCIIPNFVQSVHAVIAGFQGPAVRSYAVAPTFSTERTHQPPTVLPPPCSASLCG